MTGERHVACDAAASVGVHSNENVLKLPLVRQNLVFDTLNTHLSM